jgi:SAM-dependent methyltransferase
MEPFYPLNVYVCEECLLVQLPEYQSPEFIFSDYAYFSSYSKSWLEHAKGYAEMMIAKFQLNSKSMVVELGSNDGYLLKYFVEHGVAVLGVEPAKNVAAVANDIGVPTLTAFFNKETAIELIAQRKSADLIVGNNVLAQVPALNDFIEGMKILLKPHGIITIEFPHLMQLVAENQFDTIYHEHYSYFSLVAIEKIFRQFRLTIFDVDELPTHGGSLRIYARHYEDKRKPVDKRVTQLMQKERAAGFTKLEHYLSFNEKVHATKRSLLDFLISEKQKGKSIVGYGAPAKGNTLLNYCGIRSDFLDYTVDLNPHKQNLFLPGTHIAICHPAKIEASKPDFILILPWNLKDEIMEQMKHVREWGARFIVPIPEVAVY